MRRRQPYPAQPPQRRAAVRGGAAGLHCRAARPRRRRRSGRLPAAGAGTCALLRARSAAALRPSPPPPLGPPAERRREKGRRKRRRGKRERRAATCCLSSLPSPLLGPCGQRSAGGSILGRVSPRSRRFSVSWGRCAKLLCLWVAGGLLSLRARVSARLREAGDGAAAGLGGAAGTAGLPLSGRGLCCGHGGHWFIWQGNLGRSRHRCRARPERAGSGPRRGYCAAPRRRGPLRLRLLPLNSVFIEIPLRGDRLQFVSLWHLLLVLETLLRGREHPGRAGAAFQSVAKRAASTS